MPASAKADDALAPTEAPARKARKPRVRRFEPTDAQRAAVSMVLATGGDLPELASFFQVTERTIRAHFPKEIQEGKLNFKARLRITLGRKALAGDKSILIFLAKTVLGMKEVTAHEHSGPNAGPIATEARVKVQLPDLSALSEEDLARLYREMVEPVPPAA